MGYKPKKIGSLLVPMKAQEYSEKAGFKNIKVLKPKEIRTIHRREASGCATITSNWPNYMRFGSKSYCCNLLIYEQLNYG